MCLCLYTRQGYSVVDLNPPRFLPSFLQGAWLYRLAWEAQKGWKMLENSGICCSNLRISSPSSRDFDVNEVKLGCLRVVLRGKSFFGLRRVTSLWDFLRDVFC